MPIVNNQVEKRKQGIFAHTCGGLHFVQAVARWVLTGGGDAERARLRRQLDLVLFRWDAERRIYARMIAAEPRYRVLLLVQALLALEADSRDPRQIDEAFRLLHSIKGSSALLGLDRITALTHHLESHFVQIRSGRRTLDAATMSATRWSTSVPVTKSSPARLPTLLRLRAFISWGPRWFSPTSIPAHTPSTPRPWRP